MTDVPTVVLYSRPGCHLCETAAAALSHLSARFPHRLEVVDIGGDAELLARYGSTIPVLVAGSREYPAPLTPAILQQALEAAR